MNPNYLDFEQPIAELEAKIRELQLMDDDQGLDIDEEIERLRTKSTDLTRSIFANLGAWQVNQLARHPQLPTSPTISSGCSPTSANCTAIVPSATTRRSSAAWRASTACR